jgi:hypothetical protein
MINVEEENNFQIYVRVSFNVTRYALGPLRPCS